MIRVLLLVTDLQRGGTPLRVVRWSRWLRRIDVEPVVGCLAGPGPLSDELGCLGVAHFACGASHPLDATALVRLARHIRRLNPDLIHSLLFHANLAARLVGRLDRRRPIVTNTVTVEVERIWHRRLEQLTARLSDAHVCNAPAVARDVVGRLGFPAHRVVVIPNGVDLDTMDAAPSMDRARLGIPEGVPLLVWVGRMDPVKDLITWIEVFDAVRRRMPVCGLLIGDGPERGRITSELKRRGLLATPDGVNAQAELTDDRGVGRVTLAGWSDDVAGWLKAADVFLLTSRTEGSPNAVLEAMACGCTVVAWDVGGCSDCIRDDETGILCPLGDVAALVSGVEHATQERRQRPRIAAAARSYIEKNHAPQVVLACLDRFYRAILSGKA